METPSVFFFLYLSLPKGNELGMLEIVLGANTIANIQKGQSGYSGAFDRKALRSWLWEKNVGGSTEDPGKGGGKGGSAAAIFETVVDNFVHSSAGYCVLSYVLGIGVFFIFVHFCSLPGTYPKIISFAVLTLFTYLLNLVIYFCLLYFFCFFFSFSFKKNTHAGDRHADNIMLKE